MKNFILLLSMQLCLCGCANYLSYPSFSESEKTVLIQVECTNRYQVESSVMQVLRIVHINDLEKQNYEPSLLIKARYQELPYDKAMRIKDDLQRLPGVLDIQIITDGVPVRNIR